MRGDIQVSFRSSFVHKFKSLPAGLQEEVLEKIGLLKNSVNHRHIRVHKLKGRLTGRFSFSVNFEYRIVFEYISKKEVALLAIGTHKVYE